MPTFIMTFESAPGVLLEQLQLSEFPSRFLVEVIVSAAGGCQYRYLPVYVDDEQETNKLTLHPAVLKETDSSPHWKREKVTSLYAEDAHGDQSNLVLRGNYPGEDWSDADLQEAQRLVEFWETHLEEAPVDPPVPDIEVALTQASNLLPGLENTDQWEVAMPRYQIAYAQEEEGLPNGLAIKASTIVEIRGVNTDARQFEFLMHLQQAVEDGTLALDTWTPLEYQTPPEHTEP